MTGLVSDRLRRACVRLLGLVMVGVLLATTGCAIRIRTTLDGVSYRGDAFYAVISQGPGERRDVRSEDGGMTWTVISKAQVPPRMRGLGDIEQCAHDGVCYRLNQEGLVVERGNPDRGWVVEYRSRIPVRELAVDLIDSSRAVVQLDRTDIAFRSRSGVWSELDLVELTDPPRWQMSLLGLVREPMTTAVLAVTLALLGGLGARTDQFRTLWIVGTLGFAGFIYSLSRSMPGWDLLWLQLGWLIISVSLLGVYRRITARSRDRGYR